jgi:4-hydroxythreonine-4-phosphate dehydrogenase
MFLDAIDSLRKRRFMKIVISMGDVTGIGPEVTLKALAEESETDDAQYLLVGDVKRTMLLNQQLGVGLPLTVLGEKGDPRFCIHNPLSESLPQRLEAGSPTASRAAVAWLTDAGQRCLRQEADAMVTAPVSKEAIIRSGQPFTGATEFLSDLAGLRRTVMMLLGPDDRKRWLRVALVTTHVPLGLVVSHITKDKVALAIELGVQACKDLGLIRRRVGVCGLNPHAGEGGKMGTEEMTLIQPVIEAARKKGLDVEGPFAADTLFHRAIGGDFDVVVAMYHDQGLGPLKLVAFDSGVNWTLGLPFIRTSPDHGTAYDIAGQNKANPSSMRAAIRLAKQVARNRGAQ